ncbi:unnamed protein product [Absidia cylindrospora]
MNHDKLKTTTKTTRSSSVPATLIQSPNSFQLLDSPPSRPASHGKKKKRHHQHHNHSSRKSQGSIHSPLWDDITEHIVPSTTATSSATSSLSSFPLESLQRSEQVNHDHPPAPQIVPSTSLPIIMTEATATASIPSTPTTPIQPQPIHIDQSSMHQSYSHFIKTSLPSPSPDTPSTLSPTSPPLSPSTLIHSQQQQQQQQQDSPSSPTGGNHNNNRQDNYGLPSMSFWIIFGTN